MVKNILKKIIPKNWLLFYHKTLALLASFLFQNPSEKIVVIGVTGTAGKSTTVYLIGKMLEKCGWRVGWTSSISFKGANGEIINKEKMTMPGRFFLQRFLSGLVKNNYQAVVVETSSEGILQSRHLGINYDAIVFTNLSPEHIEVHGGFENYKKTKARLFAHLKKQKNKIINGQEIKKTIFVNLDSEHAGYFLSFPADERYGYSISDTKTRIHQSRQQAACPPFGGDPPTGGNDTNRIKIIEAENVANSSFTISPFVPPNGTSASTPGASVDKMEDKHNSLFHLQLPGRFNVYNALAAISVAEWLKIPLEQAKKALESINLIPGRMEEIISQPFKVIVDYAHTPIELENVYLTLANQHKSTPRESAQMTHKSHEFISEISDQIREHSRLICVLGSCGGGRDKWKRPMLGKLATQYCQQIILTDEDPYDENPTTIIKEIEAGFSQIRNPKSEIRNYEIILNRKEAIKKAISLAKPGDTVIITGKGCEPWMCVANGQKIAWDDRQIVKDELTILSAKTNLIKSQ